MMKRTVMIPCISLANCLPISPLLLEQMRQQRELAYSPVPWEQQRKKNNRLEQGAEHSGIIVSPPVQRHIPEQSYPHPALRYHNPRAENMPCSDRYFPFALSPSRHPVPSCASDHVYHSEEVS